MIPAAAVTLAACSDSTRKPVCALSAATTSPVAIYPAIRVEVRGSITGARITSGSYGAVHDGAYVDSLRPFYYIGDTLVELGAAYNRAGTYDVEVIHPGYAAWSTSGVQVTANFCDIGESILLTARLVPSP